MSDNHYFDLLNKTLERIEDKVDKNTDLTQKVHMQAQKTNGKVIKLRDDVDGLLVSTTNKKIDPVKLPDFWSDPMIKRTVFIVAVAFLTLIIAVTGVNIVGSFK
jgi:hypothetical protein